MAPAASERISPKVYATSNNGATLHVSPNYPIDSPPSLGIPFLLVGLFLALHPVAWISLSFFYEPWRLNYEESSFVDASYLVNFMDAMAYWILEWTPQLASKLLVLVLSTCCLVVGVAFLRKGLSS